MLSMKRYTAGILSLGLLWSATRLAAETWEEKQVTDNPPYYSGEPAIAAAESMVYVVWEDYRDGNYETYFKKSPDGKTGWTADQRLTFNTAKSWRPDIAAVGQYVFVVWEDNHYGTGSVFFTASTDGGGNWSAPYKVNQAAAYAGFPSVFADTGGVYVAWEDARTGYDEIFFKLRTAAGWQPDRQVTASKNDSWGADVAVDSKGVIHLVWFDFRTGNDEIFYSRSGDKGQTWLADKPLTNDPEISWDPRIAIDRNDNLHVVWYDWRDQKDEVYYKRSRDGGATWTADRRISDLGNADSRYPDVACLADKVYIVWEDFRDGNDEIYCAVSPDLGQTWGANLRLTNDPSDSWAGVVTTNAQGVYVTWYDYRTGADEIFGQTAISQTGLGSDIRTGDLRGLLAGRACPNPFKISTGIHYDVSRGRGISIYDMQGKLVISLPDKKATGQVVWNGTDQAGHRVLPGVYLYRTGRTSAGQPIMLLGE